MQAAIETKRSGMPSPDEAHEATPQGRAEQGRVGQCAAKSLCRVPAANLRHQELKLVLVHLPGLPLEHLLPALPGEVETQPRLLGHPLGHQLPVLPGVET